MAKGSHQKRRQAISKPAFATSLSFQDAFGLYYDTHVREHYPEEVAVRIAWISFKHCKAHFPKRMRDLKATDFTGYPRYLPVAEAEELFEVLKGFFEWCKAQNIITSVPANLNTAPKWKS